MIYKKYGEVFKKLRLQHHLLLSDFTGKFIKINIVLF